MLVTFDIDGVVCNGEYTPRDIRTPEYYLGLEPIAGAQRGLVKLAKEGVHVEYITSRAYKGAYDMTIQWMRQHGIPTGKGLHIGVEAWEKPRMADTLGAHYHVDDHPMVNMILRRYVDGMDPIMFIDPRYRIGWEDPYGITQELKLLGLVMTTWDELVRFILAMRNP